MFKPIPLSVPFLKGNEWAYVKDCLDSGWVSSAGKYVEKFERKLASFTGSRYAVAVTSGTAALQVSLQLAGVRPGDEVIVPTVTFIAPVNAVSYLQASPVFMDCDDYYNIDAEKVITFLKEETTSIKGVCINKRTRRPVRAMIVVHVFGHAARLDKLLPVCKRRNIKIIEDATESLGTYYAHGSLKGRYTGAVGDFGCFSFNGNKILTTGGGGMIVTGNRTQAGKARYLTTQAKDDPVRFVHNAVGYNFRLTNVQAALGVAQAENLHNVIKIKKDNYFIYQKLLKDIDGIRLAETPPYARSNYWMYALSVDRKCYGRGREDLIKMFTNNKIEVRPLFYLNHRQKPYRTFQAYRIEKATILHEKTLNIPSSAGLTREEIVRIVNLIKKWKRK